MYLSAIQAVLPRLLSAAAPPGSAAHENRRQCLKASKALFSLLGLFNFPLIAHRNSSLLQFIIA